VPLNKLMLIGNYADRDTNTCLILIFLSTNNSKQASERASNNNADMKVREEWAQRSE
jgi:hypothetical protein